ncbi:hypothetical protein ACQ9A7_23745 [Enterobacter hormaechei]|uniref:hypothetical protein n=1 Tax=Enterobacter hormaechei TaxID=158836 RepID=UPI003D35D8DF
MDQEEAQLIPGDRSGAEGLAENDMPVQLPDRGLRIGDQLIIAVTGRDRFQAVIEETFGQGVDRGIFATGAHFQRLDQLFVKTQVKLAEHHRSFHVRFVHHANLASVKCVINLSFDADICDGFITTESDAGIATPSVLSSYFT